MEPTTTKAKYFENLDSLRALAVFMTIIAHWFPAVGFPKVPYSWLGVEIFFCISGFLITLLLLKEKKKIELEGRGKLKSIKNFFLRRALRLFPAYYLFLFFFWVTYSFFNIKIWRPELAPYLLTYTPNFLFFEKGFYTGSFDHTWSLGVEEQFYLIWPWAIFFLFSKRYEIFFIAIIIFSITIRAYFIETPNISTLPISNLHTLGIGALLALLYNEYYDSKIFQWFYRHISYLLLIAFNTLLIILFIVEVSNIHLQAALSETFIAITAGCLVVFFMKDFTGLLKITFGNRALKEIGKISYGLYLFHMPIPVLFYLVLKKLGITLNPYADLVAMLGILFIISLISYHIIEKRVLKHKHKFY